MNRNILYSCLFITFSVLIGCNSIATKEEKSSSNSYTSQEIGWTVEIPSGYKLTSQAKKNADDQKGKEATEKVYHGELKKDSIKHLLSFMRNQFNSFDSTIEPYEEAKAGEYVANQILIRNLIFDTYQEQGIKVDTSSVNSSLKGQSFNAFYLKIFGPNGDIVINQIMFSKILKGYDFGVQINYNNEADKKALVSAFMNASFR